MYHQIYEELNQSQEIPDSGKILKTVNGYLIGWGTTVPSDADEDWAPGALYLHTDGATASTVVYFNVGNATSCDFDPIDVAGSNLSTSLASTANGDGASLVAIEDAAANFTATDVEAALAEIISLLASTSNGEGAAMIGVEDSAGNFTGATVEAVLAEIIADLAATTNGNGASLVGVEDAGTFTSAANVEAALAEYQHLLTAQAFVPLTLMSFREASAFDVGNVAANGGLLASDTTPLLEGINGATDGCQRIVWAATDTDPVMTQITLPPDLDDASDLVLHVRAAMSDTNDTPTIALTSFFNEGDTAVADATAAITGTSYAEYTATIGAADVPSGAQTMSLRLTPAAHGNDALYVTGVWLEYKRKVLTS